MKSIIPINEQDKIESILSKQQEQHLNLLGTLTNHRKNHTLFVYNIYTKTLTKAIYVEDLTDTYDPFKTKTKTLNLLKGDKVILALNSENAKKKIEKLGLKVI